MTSKDPEFKVVVVVPERDDSGKVIPGTNKYYKLDASEIVNRAPLKDDEIKHNKWDDLVEMDVHMGHKPSRPTELIGTYLVNLAAFAPKPR